MKRVLVMADTHGNKPAIARAVHRFADVDAVVHLGDYADDAEYVRQLTNVPVYAVRGNCDIYSDEKRKRILTIGGKRLLMVHGHKQKVKSGLLRMGLYAQEKQVDAALFGHSHLPAQTMFSGIILYNPGSLGEPRHLKPTVGIITIDGDSISIKTHAV